MTKRLSDLAVHFSSDDEHWNTPDNILKPIRRMAGGQIYLDPCSNPTSRVGSVLAWDEAYNGLRHKWVPHTVGLVYCNPPYGRKIIRWAKKIRTETTERLSEIVAVLPARVDTAWWHNFIKPSATAFCFYRGRLKFYSPARKKLTPAPFPTVITYHGPRVGLFLEEFSAFGWTFPAPPQIQGKQMILL